MSIQQVPLAGMEPYKRPDVRPTYVDLLQVCLNNGGAIEVVKELAALEREAKARDAEVSFNDAMNHVQAELESVVPDLVNKGASNRKYASYAAMDKAIRPVYTKHGFSLSFDTKPTEIVDVVHVVCYVSHRDGHSRQYNAVLPSDGKGAKGGEVMSKTWATGSAMSYGMRYLLKMIFNIAIGEEEVTNEWMSNELRAMENATTVAGLREIYQAAYKQAVAEKNGQAVIILAQKYDKLKEKF